jgi:cell division protein FtsL
MRRQWVELSASIALAAAVVGSGLWVVAAKHDARQLFAELEELKRETDRLEIDWGRLQIEQSTFANHPRVETLARDRLAMAPPRQSQIVIITGPAE